MPNVLTGVVQITAPGAAATFQAVQGGVVKTESAIQKLGTALSTTGANGFKVVGEASKLAGSKLGDLTDVVNSTASSIPEITNAASTAGSSLLKLAASFELGRLAGHLLAEVAIEIGQSLFGAASAFEDADIMAGRFSNTMKQLKEDVEDFKTSLDFEGDLKKISLQMQGLTGAKLTAASGGVDVEQNIKFIGELSDKINQLTSSNDKLIKYRIEIEKTLNKIGEASKLAKAIVSAGGIDNVSDALLKDLTKGDQEIVKEYRQTNDEIKTLSKQRTEALFGIAKNVAGVAVPFIQQKDKPFKEPFRPRIILRPVIAEIEFDFKEIQRILAGGENKKSFAEEIQDTLTKQIEKLVIKPVLTMSVKGLKTPKELQDMNDKLKGLANIIENTLTPAFQNFFDTVANGGNAFKAFANAAGQALIGLIEKLAIAAILSLILSSIGGGIGIAIGAGGNKFTDIFKFLSGFGGHRAGGGPVQSGQGYIVGENGPEYFRPNTGGSIVPNHHLGTGMGGRGGMAVQISGEFVQRGQDLLAVITLANQSKARLI